MVKKTGPAKRRPAPKTHGRSGRPGGRPVVEANPATLGTWISGARPATLLLAPGPIVLGTAAATLDPSMPSLTHHWVRALACLAIIVCLQIGVNFANDYSDGVRGTDQDRIGPARLVGSGRARPRTVLTVALVFFGLAALAGLFVIWRSGAWWLLAVGAVCILAAWFYTGGKRPYGYLPLGELAVMIFFGIVPTVGTMFVQVGRVNFEALLLGIAMGAFAAAVLITNNLRDRVKDRESGKRTLAVLLGNVGSRILFGLLMLVPYGVLVYFTLLYFNTGYAYFTALAAVPAIIIVSSAREPRELVTALKLTSFTSLAYGVGLGLLIAMPV